MGSIFCFDSLLNGNHEKGSQNARIALAEFGAVQGVAAGLQGRSFAIPVWDSPRVPRPPEALTQEVEKFKDFARTNRWMVFDFAPFLERVERIHGPDFAKGVAIEMPRNVLLPHAYREPAPPANRIDMRVYDLEDRRVTDETVPFRNTGLAALFPEGKFHLTRLGNLEKKDAVERLQKPISRRQIDFASKDVVYSDSNVAPVFWKYAEGPMRGYGALLLTEGRAVASFDTIKVLMVDKSPAERLRNGTGDGFGWQISVNQQNPLWAATGGDPDSVMQYRMFSKTVPQGEKGFVFKGVLGSLTLEEFTHSNPDLAAQLPPDVVSGDTPLLILDADSHKSDRDLPLGLHEVKAPVLVVKEWSFSGKARSAFNQVQWLPAEVIKTDFLPAAKAEAEELNAIGNDPYAAIRYFVRSQEREQNLVETEVSQESEQIEEKQPDRFDLTTMLKTTGEALYKHPYVQTKISEQIQKRWRHLFTGAGFYWDTRMSVPSERLPNYQVCSYDMPEGWRIFTRQPSRGPQDFVAVLNVHHPNLKRLNGTMYMNHFTASLVAADFDGDPIQSLAGDQFPNFMKWVAKVNRNRQFDLAKEKAKKRQTPLENDPGKNRAALAVAAWDENRHNVGKFTYLMSRVEESGMPVEVKDQLHAISAEIIQKALDSKKRYIPDFKVVAFGKEMSVSDFHKETMKMLPEVGWLKAKGGMKDPKVFLTKRIEIGTGGGRISGLIQEFYPDFVPNVVIRSKSPNDKEEPEPVAFTRALPLPHFNYLVPELPKNQEFEPFHETAVRIKWNYAEATAQANKLKDDKLRKELYKKAILGAQEETRKFAKTDADHEYLFRALWPNHKDAQGNGSLIFHLYPQLISKYVGQGAPKFDRAVFVGAEKAELKDKRFNGESVRVTIVERPLGQSLRHFALIDDQVLGTVPPEVILPPGEYDMSLKTTETSKGNLRIEAAGVKLNKPLEPVQPQLVVTPVEEPIQPGKNAFIKMDHGSEQILVEGQVIRLSDPEHSRPMVEIQLKDGARQWFLASRLVTPEGAAQSPLEKVLLNPPAPEQPAPDKIKPALSLPPNNPLLWLDVKRRLLNFGMPEGTLDAKYQQGEVYPAVIHFEKAKVLTAVFTTAAKDGAYLYGLAYDRYTTGDAHSATWPGLDLKAFSQNPVLTPGVGHHVRSRSSYTVRGELRPLDALYVFNNPLEQYAFKEWRERLTLEKFSTLMIGSDTVLAKANTDFIKKAGLTVRLAFKMDEAGRQAAKDLAAHLKALGIQVKQVTPPDPAQTWLQTLQATPNRVPVRTPVPAPPNPKPVNPPPVAPRRPAPPAIPTLQPPNPDPARVLVYTAGLVQSPATGGYAIAIRGNGVGFEIQGGFDQTTKDRMKLKAVVQALAVAPQGPLTVVTDSPDLVRAFSPGGFAEKRKKSWSDVPNSDLWKAVFAAVKNREVVFEAANGRPETEHLYELARTAASRPNLPVDTLDEELPIRPRSAPAAAQTNGHTPKKAALTPEPARPVEVPPVSPPLQGPVAGAVTPVPSKPVRAMIYADGSSLGNPGPGGYGVLVADAGGQREFSGGYAQTTNNRMELKGVIVGLRQLPEGAAATVVTDSQYVVNAFQKGWLKKWERKNYQKIQNPDLWQELAAEVKLREVAFEWVKGHAGHVENERVDKLARAAAGQPNLPPDPGYGPAPEVPRAQPAIAQAMAAGAPGSLGVVASAQPASQQPEGQPSLFDPAGTTSAVLQPAVGAPRPVEPPAPAVVEHEMEDGFDL